MTKPRAKGYERSAELDLKRCGSFSTAPITSTKSWTSPSSGSRLDGWELNFTPWCMRNGQTRTAFTIILSPFGRRRRPKGRNMKRTRKRKMTADEIEAAAERGEAVTKYFAGQV